MPSILGFHTDHETCTVVLEKDDTILSRYASVQRQQGQLLLPMIHELLAEFGISLRQLDAIAFGCGPGSFTGVRLATSVAQGLSYGANLPLLPISSLQILAQSAHPVFMEMLLKHSASQDKKQDFLTNFILKGKQVIVMTDAHVGEVYYGGYSFDAEGDTQSILSDRRAKPEAMNQDAEMMSIGFELGCGDGWNRYPDVLLNHFLGIKRCSLEPSHYSSGLMRLAKNKFKIGDCITPEQAYPNYLYEAERWLKTPSSNMKKGD